MERYLSPKEVAASLGVNVRTIYDAVNAGKLRAVKVGNRIRISERTVNAWLEANAVK